MLAPYRKSHRPPQHPVEPRRTVSESPQRPLISECAKGAAKASCAETVVQKGVRFFSAPLRFVLKNTCEVLKTLRGQSRNGLSNNTLLDNRFCARRLRRSLGAPPFESKSPSEKQISSESLWEGCALGMVTLWNVRGSRKESQ